MSISNELIIKFLGFLFLCITLDHHDLMKFFIQTRNCKNHVLIHGTVLNIEIVRMLELKIIITHTD